MEKKSKFKVSCGITSILMIFVVLCLTAFGVLSLSAASADLNLSKKNAGYISDYYKAQSSVMERLSNLSPENYGEDETVTLTEAIDDTKNIVLTVRMNPSQGGGTLEILSEKVESTDNGNESY